MKLDPFGVSHITSDELCDIIYTNPRVNLADVQVDDPEIFNQSVKQLYYEHALLEKYHQFQSDCQTIEEKIADFDKHNQDSWFMPQEYKDLDIAKWLLDQCKTEAEMQRVGQELLMFQDRDMLVVLQFMKYLVDTFRKHNVVWGVGRGSSTASYCLYLIGIHKINALFYDLDISDFLK